MQFDSLKKLFGFFDYKTRTTHGIHISDTAIRFVEILDTNGTYDIKSFDSIALPSGIIQGGVIQQSRKLSRYLKKLQKKHNIKQAYIGIVPQSFFVSYLFVPHRGDDPGQTIQDTISTYLKYNVQMPLSDIICEYDVINSDESGYDVSISVAKQDQIRGYSLALVRAGISPLSIESSLAGIHMLDSAGNGAYLAMDFSHGSTHLSIVSNGIVMQSLSVGVGGKHLDNILRKYLQLPEHKISALQREYGLRGDHPEPQVLRKMVRIIDPLRNIIEKQYIGWHSRAYKNKLQRLPINHITLYGDQGHIAGFSDHLSRSLRIPVNTINPWQSFSRKEQYVPPIPFEQSLAYAPVIGLALQGLE